jgi:hypothetical protein
MQRWLWVTEPQFWVKLRGVQLDHGLPVTWTCDKQARRGDVALLYRVDPAKDIAHLFRVDTDDPWLDRTRPIRSETPGGATRRSFTPFNSRSCYRIEQLSNVVDWQ